MIYRTFGCDDCGCEFEEHANSSSDPIPECPNCSKVLEWRPQGFAITGVKAKAIDYAQDVLEKDFGLSNFKDNNRPGDVGIIRNQETRQENELVERTAREMIAQSDNPAVKEFWGQNSGAPTNVQSMTGQSLIQMAKVGPAANDPMALLHNGVKQGKIPKLMDMTTQLRTRDNL